MKRLVTPVVFLFSAFAAVAQQPQIPTLQVCNGTEATGSGIVHIDSRKDAAHSGDFTIEMKAGCNPGNTGYPSGAITIRFNLSDGTIGGMQSTSIEQMTTTGKHEPTMFLNGRCTASPDNIPCHYWLMLANNRAATANGGTPDVVSVLVVDKMGKRLNYGTGPLVRGDINVASTGF